MSVLTRDKVVDEWLAEAELAVQAARQVVEAAQRELETARERLTRLQAARQVAAEADAVVREHAGQPPTADRVEQAEPLPVPAWRPEADPALLPREYPQIRKVVAAAGPEGIRAVGVHRLLGWQDTGAAKQNVRNRLQRLTQKGWLRLVRRGVYVVASV